MPDPGAVPGCGGLVAGKMDDARQLLASYFPGAALRWIGASERADRRVDTFLADFRAEGEDGRAFHVTSVRIDGWFVAEAVSGRCHVPYEAGLIDALPPRWSEPGVYATVWPVRDAEAVEVRFGQRGGVRTAPVIGGHCVLFDWDTAWLAAAERPVPQALRIGGAWQPSVCGVVAATPATFGRAYARYRDGERADERWAPHAFFSAERFQDKLDMVESVLDMPGLSDWCVGCLAAGPVEDLIGPELLDRLERDGAMRARWVPVLVGAYWFREPPETRRRLRVLLRMAPEAD